MDRAEIEDLVHASLGRHLRVTCVLGLMFLAIGFVLGHFVAAQHARDLSDRMSSHADQWTAQVDERVRKLEDSVKAELKEVRAIAAAAREHQQQQKAALAVAPTQAAPTVVVSSDDRVEQLLDETRRLSRAAEDLRRSLISHSIRETEREKNRILKELQPYIDRQMTVQAAEVSNAVNQLVDTQIAQLKSLADVDRTLEHPSDADGPTLTDISFISGESDAQHCPLPVDNPLIPVAEVPASDGMDHIALIPLPKADLSRSPAEAEPSVSSNTDDTKRLQNFTAPRKTRVYIPARRPLEVSTSADPTVR